MGFFWGGPKIDQKFGSLLAAKKCHLGLGQKALPPIGQRAAARGEHSIENRLGDRCALATVRFLQQARIHTITVSY